VRHSVLTQSVIHVICWWCCVCV